MSNLQIGLIVLGVLLILLVLGFNWWQDRRARSRMQARFPTSEQDPLLSDGEGAVRSSADAKRREPGMGPEHVAAAATAAAAAPANDVDDTEEPDPGCEVVIEIHLGEPMLGAELLPAIQGVHQVGTKPVRVFATTEAGRHRARIHPEESYASLQLAALLANRSGPLTAIEWSQLWARAQELADRFEATIEGPDQQVVLERAVKLDELCAALDAQVGLTLLLREPRSTIDVISVARELGFAVDNTRLLWLTDTGATRFTLSRGDGAGFDDGMAAVSRLVLLLDVPCSPADSRAFGRMVDVGRDLAARLQAELVDDQGRPVVDGMETGIDEQLQTLFSKLDQAGLPAGSVRAQRVFA
ncbi:cell division protein ZipA C-terminal FtsZ-binding domain-containing protein [Bordetella tumulicola]|uniref:cell division protein ZipA C-terminal FtsZ-binding domain-containing protein n=1 Tax=Bordetella tumulicola TaxID=1649133 RepID=UPI0039F09CC5